MTSRIIFSLHVIIMCEQYMGSSDLGCFNNLPSSVSSYVPVVLKLNYNL